MRADPQIAQKLSELNKAEQKFRQFDMVKLEKDFDKELNVQIQRLAEEFNEHRQIVEQRMDSNRQQNEMTEGYRKETVQTRHEKLEQYQ